jgi:hypothetical protein
VTQEEEARRRREGKKKKTRENRGEGRERSRVSGRPYE